MDHDVIPAASYRITVEGKIDSSWSDWFSGLSIASQKVSGGKYVTIFSGILLDQAALRGLLNRLWDLNLELLSLQRVDPQN